MEKSPFDMAIVGAGCAGFQLLSELARQPLWPQQQVVLFDDGIPQQRSWCFWSKTVHPLQHLVAKSWHRVTFKGAGFSKTENVWPYQYHYIPGERFFDYFYQDFLPKQANIQIFTQKVTDLTVENNHFNIAVGSKQWSASTVFSSLMPDWETLPAQFKLKQHFIGWFIKTAQPVFDDTTLTLMDFSIPQQSDTRFVYVLPFSPTEALVEMTVFSPEVYPDVVYESVLAAYIENHFPGVAFTINRTERGAIPMTDAIFARYGPHGEVLLGTAAGMVKATTGYAFKRITADCQQLAENCGALRPQYAWPKTKGRFRFYDRLLLGILTETPLVGRRVFEALFKSRKITTVFKFLDEETSLWEEIGIFCRLPFLPFLKQLYKQWKW